MISLGLDNALFWSLVIFVLNYIPLIGAAAAWILPTLFAMVQFDSTGKILLLAVLLFAVQTVIANTLQPKMMGDSMNLSALVVVLSITLWGALWGGVGAFLSAPLTVIIMIILAQFSTTRWIAVLLSSDGQPDLDPVDKIKATSTPSL
jgi:predicted PurR-regulated permease PerM